MLQKDGKCGLDATSLKLSQVNEPVVDKGNAVFTSAYGRTIEADGQELTIKTSYVNPHTTGRAIALLASGLIDTKHIFAKVMEPEEAVEELLQPNYCRTGKVLVRISGERA